MIPTIFFLSLLLLIKSEPPQQDKIPQIPGYPSSFTNRVFGGYLSTGSQLRKLHYVFIQSNKGIDNKDPITLWMNGGPGCTSKIGFIQQIMPYVLQADQPYKTQDDLSFNRYGWLNLTNLLFIDSPAGAGYSINNDHDFIFNDANTAKDNYDALQSFFTQKFTNYTQNKFYIAGESYAGKYIPDLAARILSQNKNIQSNSVKINLSGVMIGNGIMYWPSLEENSIDYIISRNFVDPKLIPYWQRSCKIDTGSAGCRYFYQRYEDLMYRINQYNMYGSCYGRKKPPQQSLMSKLSYKMSLFSSYKQCEHEDDFTEFQQKNSQKQTCNYDKGLQSYLNINAQSLKSQKTSQIKICNKTIFDSYKVSPQGSMPVLPSLLQQGLKVYLYNGDLDSVVPYTDTYKNLYKLGLKMQGKLTPWKVDNQHAGFSKKYTLGLNFYLVKGAGHQAPLYQRSRMYNLFEKFIYDV